MRDVNSTTGQSPASVVSIGSGLSPTVTPYRLTFRAKRGSTRASTISHR
jgi:hypothetical protein